jgi:hypothetical protein
MTNKSRVTAFGCDASLVCRGILLWCGAAGGDASQARCTHLGWMHGSGMPWRPSSESPAPLPPPYQAARVTKCTRYAQLAGGADGQPLAAGLPSPTRPSSRFIARLTCNHSHHSAICAPFCCSRLPVDGSSARAADPQFQQGCSLSSRQPRQPWPWCKYPGSSSSS